MKILTVGGATKDIFIQRKEQQLVEFRDNSRVNSYILVPEGAKLEVDSLWYCTGGGATNSAASFNRLGFDVQSFFKIAYDDQGLFIKTQLEELGISIHNIIIADAGISGTSFIISSARDSSIFAFRGVNATIGIKEFPFGLLEGNKCIYITSLSGRSSQLLLPLAQKAKELGIMVATNPGTSQLAAGAKILKQSLPYLDVLILNKIEAQKFMLTLVRENRQIMTKTSDIDSDAPKLLQSLLEYQDICFNIAHYFQEIASQGPKIIAVTNGAEGVYVYHQNKIYFQPSLPVHIGSTVGAGDAFGSTFVASILKGNSVAQAAVHGVINSASVLEYLDAKQGLLDWNSLQKKADIVGLHAIQEFDIS